jgi:DNA-binding PucR family transcriptional regulator
VKTGEQEIAAALRLAVERFEPEVGELARRAAEHIAAEIPEIGAEPEIVAEVRGAVRASVVGWLRMVTDELPAADIAPPEDALQLARTAVLRGAPLAVLLRVYRVGHGFVIREWLPVLHATAAEEPELLGRLVERVLELSFAYVDATSAQIAEFFATERERLVRSADAARAETTRAIVAGAPVDVDAASSVLGYELRRRHVGMIVWVDPADDAEDPLGMLEAAANEIAATLGGGRPLLVPAGRSLLWGWCATETLSDDAAAALKGRRRDGVSGALGEPGEGLAGFARTHADALEARRVALLARPAGSVTRYRDVDLLSLLLGDVERAREFVEAELGALAGEDDATTRLRATLRAYLEEGRSFTAAARRLGVHENTVKYRVRRCEELLGRGAGERSLKLAAAIVLADTLGPRA